MTYYILEPEQEWADGYFFVNADTDAEAVELATEEKPTMSFEIAGTLHELRDRVDEGYPQTHDKVFEID